MKTHISLNVKDIEKSVEFYGKMFDQKPMKFINSKRGYAKFDIEDPPLNLALNEGSFETGGGLSHLGLQVETTGDVMNFRQRWSEKGLVTVDEMDVSCCYAKQDKTWVRDPDGNEWEAFVVLENLEAKEAENACDCGEKVLGEVRDTKNAVVSCCDTPNETITSDHAARETCCVSS